MDSPINEKMLQAVASAKKSAQEAQQLFDKRDREIQRKAGSTINLFGGDAPDRVVEIAGDVRRACDDLYASYQTLVRILDEQCRPLLEQEPSAEVVYEVYSTIKWLNEESEIKTQFTASLNSQSLGSVASGQYVPTMENKMIQQYWGSKFDQHPGAEQARQQKLGKNSKADKNQQQKENTKQKQKLEKEQQAWEQQAAQIKKEHSEAEKKGLAEIRENAANQEKKLTEAEKKEIIAAEQAVVELEKQAADAENELSTLGFLQIARKRNLRKLIKDAQERLPNMRQKPKLIQEQYGNKRAALNKKTRKKEKELLQNLEKQYRIPESPVDRAERIKKMTPLQLANEALKEAMLKYLRHKGQSSVEDIVENCPAARGLTCQKIHPLLLQLVATGDVERIVKNRDVFFKAVE